MSSYVSGARRPVLRPGAFVFAIMLLLLAPSAAAAQCGNDGNGFEAWLAQFRQRAASEGITPATMGNVTTISRWLGLLGTLIFPMLADLYGRKPMLILSILGYSLFTGLTGFATGWITLLIFTSINRVALAGELPIGMVMVSETAPTKWRATALGVLVGGYPFGYMLCTLLASVVSRMTTGSTRQSRIR